MNGMYELKEKLHESINEYGKKDLSASTLPTIKDLVKTAYYLDKIIHDGEEEYSNYSGRYNRSYARGRKRDSMGRYSSNGYSYDDELMHDRM